MHTAEDDELNDRVSRLRMHQFSSFTSQSSHDSSCVTPSPPGSPMTLEEDDGNSNNNGGVGLGSNEVGVSKRSLAALSKLSKRKSLTDQEKAERAQKYLVFPPPPPIVVG